MDPNLKQMTWELYTPYWNLTLCARLRKRVCGRIACPTASSLPPPLSVGTEKSASASQGVFQALITSEAQINPTHDAYNVIFTKAVHRSLGNHIFHQHRNT